MLVLVAKFWPWSSPKAGSTTAAACYPLAGDGGGGSGGVSPDGEAFH
jgi:hypothetical protein